MKDGAGVEILESDLLELVIDGHIFDYQPSVEKGSYLPGQTYRERMETAAALLRTTSKQVELRKKVKTEIRRNAE